MTRKAKNKKKGKGIDRAGNYSEMSSFTQRWVVLLSPFASDYSARISGSELARKAGIPQQTASRVLNLLSSRNIISHTNAGSSKTFYLDSNRQTTPIIFSIIENFKALWFMQSNIVASVAVSEILRHCEGVIVFGSYASGKQDEESDLDIVVLGRCEKDRIREIKSRHNLEINEHYAGYNEFGRILNSGNPLSLEISGNHIIFGDSSRVISFFLRRQNGRR